MSMSLLRALRVPLFLVLAMLPGCSCGGDERVCGNAVIEKPELCDDGNTQPGDGCSANCQIEPTAACGNNAIDMGEECDDGNTTSMDGCSASCTNELCGNGTLDSGEACDDGNTVGMDGCSSACAVETVCGNGLVEPGEPCDDGNDVDYDGCEDNCSITPAEVICQTLTPLPTGTCQVTAGDANVLVVGDVLDEFTIFRGGEVLVDAMGIITCSGCSCAAMAPGATEVLCPTGIISPALINAHDHITYTHNQPYTDTGERYEHRHDWRLGIRGHTEINSSGGASQDRIRWGELRFLMSGATAIAGSGSATGVLRNLDKNEQEGLNQTPVNYATFPLGDSSGTLLSGSCSYPSIDTNQSIAADDAYFPHISEGIDEFARNEFVCVSSSSMGGEDLLEPQSAFIHAIGLTPLDYARMADQGTSLIWSPRSNITLYGDTAVVTAAARLGVSIALGTDWMPTGSMNMQRELACADSLNQAYFDGFFDDRALWEMTTSGAAQAAAVDDVMGKLEPNMVADIAVFDGATNTDFRAVIDATPGDVVLVMRGGTVLYGDDAVVSGLTTSSCDALDVCGRQKRVCLVDDIGMDLAALTASVGTMYPLAFCSTPTNEPSCKPMRSAAVMGSTTYSGDPTATDPDGDGIDDAADNCPNVFNPVRPVDKGAQGDFDADSRGDACDPCPLSPDDANCPAYSAADTDADGIPNGMDNCPETPNPGQADGDGDNRGDACDACPTVPNPAPQACPASIYDIKQGLVTGGVGVVNALVTGCKDGAGFFAQVKLGDAGYMGPDYSGVFVYHPSAVCTGGTANVRVGDRVTMNPATVTDFYGQIQLNNANVAVLSSGEPPPLPVVVTAVAAGGTAPTPLESVVVEVQNVIVTQLDPPAGPGDSNPNNEFVVATALRVNDFLHLVTPFPAVNTVYATLRGVLNYRNGHSKLEPRAAADLVLGAPVLIGLSPPTSYARQGTMGAPTIPTPMTVTLSGNVTTNTFVSITSSSPSSLTIVGNGVTVPSGMSSAPVLVNALQQALSVGITAQLGSNILNADIRVVGIGELPRPAALSPSAASVAPMGMLAMQVLLDIPADVPSGNSVTLSLTPGTFGSVPPNVTVAANQLSAPFTFTAGSMTGTETLQASLNGGNATAIIDVSTGGGLVINELDYDQIGTDVDEFVELLNTTSVPMSTTGLALVFVNGSNNTEYRRIDLTPAVSLAAGQYLVVGTATMLANVPMTAKTLLMPLASDNVQNGAPDAVGILDVGSSTLIDALSYEGSITMGNVMGAGILSFVEGNPTSVSDSNTVVRSLIRDPNGSDTDDAATDWAITASLTPGVLNVP